jgi:hypothetical protein
VAEIESVAPIDAAAEKADDTAMPEATPCQAPAPNNPTPETVLTIDMIYL